MTTGMQESVKRIITGVIFLIVSLVIAILGYMAFGWSPLDAIYMVIITIYGVGYGEVRPLETPAERIFTIAVIVAGTSCAIYIIGAFVQMITEGEINRAFNTQRKERIIANLNAHIIICGFDRMGQVLARHLDEARQPFIILDHQSERANTAEEMGYLVRCAEVTDEETLQAAGIERARVLAAILPDDVTNVFVTLTARELNSKLTILARGTLPSTEQKLRIAGANRVVLPDAISGIQMANMITQSTALDFLNEPNERSYLNELLANIDVHLGELLIPQESNAVGKTIMELKVRGRGAFIVVALRRAEGDLIFHPHPSQIVNNGDTLIIIGQSEEIPKFAETYQLKQQLKFSKSQSSR